MTRGGRDLTFLLIRWKFFPFYLSHRQHLASRSRHARRQVVLTDVPCDAFGLVSERCRFGRTPNLQEEPTTPSTDTTREAPREAKGQKASLLSHDSSAATQIRPFHHELSETIVAISSLRADRARRPPSAQELGAPCSCRHQSQSPRQGQAQRCVDPNIALRAHARPATAIDAIPASEPHPPAAVRCRSFTVARRSRGFCGSKRATRWPPLGCMGEEIARQQRYFCSMQWHLPHASVCGVLLRTDYDPDVDDPSLPIGSCACKGLSAVCEPAAKPRCGWGFPVSFALALDGRVVPDWLEKIRQGILAMYGVRSTEKFAERCMEFLGLDGNVCISASLTT